MDVVCSASQLILDAPFFGVGAGVALVSLPSSLTENGDMLQFDVAYCAA